MLLVFIEFLKCQNYKCKCRPQLLFISTLKSQINVSKGSLLDKHYANFYKESFFSNSNNGPLPKQNQTRAPRTELSEIYSSHSSPGKQVADCFLSLRPGRGWHSEQNFHSERRLRYSGCAKLLQSYLTFCDPVKNNPLGSSIHGVLQARILEWVAMPSSRGSSQARDWTCIFYISCIFTTSATWEARAGVPGSRCLAPRLRSYVTLASYLSSPFFNDLLCKMWMIRRVLISFPVKTKCVKTCKAFRKVPGIQWVSKANYYWLWGLLCCETSSCVLLDKYLWVSPTSHVLRTSLRLLWSFHFHKPQDIICERLPSLGSRGRWAWGKGKKGHVALFPILNGPLF